MNSSLTIKKHHHIKLMCKTLRVSRISYYNNINKKASNRELKNKRIENEILNIYEANKNRYEALKVNKSLKSLGITISLKKTQRLMKTLSIKSIIIKKFRPAPSKTRIAEC
ncbi:hypothetical protein EXQ33_03530 [Clostridium botulinum]|nr:hypothetical protein [Clostridium botulinum]